MTDTTITIGWTKSDMDKGYSSFMGYREGAEQHTETIVVDIPDDADESLIAEWVFQATNYPAPGTLTGAAHAIFVAIVATGYRGRGAHYSLSVGDTITTRRADGTGDTTLACENTGWRVVS